MRTGASPGASRGGRRRRRPAARRPPRAPRPSARGSESVNATASFNRKNTAALRHTDDYIRKFSHGQDELTGTALIASLNGRSPLPGRAPVADSAVGVRVANGASKGGPEPLEGMFRAPRPELSQGDGWKGKWARRCSNDLIQDVTEALGMLPKTP